MSTERTLTPKANWREVHDGYVEECYRPPSDMVEEHKLTPRQVQAWTEARRREFDRALGKVLRRYGCTRISTTIFRDENIHTKDNGEPLEDWDLEDIKRAVKAINYERADRAYSNPESNGYIGPSDSPTINEPEGFLTTVAWFEDGTAVTATRITTNPSAGPRWLVGIKVGATWWNDGIFEWRAITDRDAFANPGHSTLRVVRDDLADEELQR